MQLAYCGAAAWTMRDTIDHEATHAADTLATVVVEGDWLLTSGDQLFVDHIEHLQEGHIRTDVPGLILHETAMIMGVFLTPHMKGHIHYL
jgi:hypothetical protein